MLFFAASRPVIGRGYAVVLLELFVKASYAFEAAGVAYLHHALVGRAQKLRRVVHTEVVHELGKSASENFIEYIRKIGVIVANLVRKVFQRYNLVVILLNVV